MYATSYYQGKPEKYEKIFEHINIGLLLYLYLDILNNTNQEVELK